jgi:hypothetical protein
MKGSVLSVNVIDARNLLPLAANRRFANAQVKMSIEGQSMRTQEVANTNDPVWNEVIPFDITEGREKLQLSVIDVVSREDRQEIGKCEIDLDFLCEDNEVDQMKKDRLCDLGNGSQIRVAIQWIYSKVKLLKDIQAELQAQIEDDEQYLKEAAEDLESMKQPFGGKFMIKAAQHAAEEQGDEELANRLAQISKEED